MNDGVRLLDVFLVLDVLFDDRKRCTPYGRDEIRVGPERRQPPSEPRNLLAQKPG
jgi:hypothetical protein